MRLVLQSVFIPREGQLIILTGTAVLNGHVQPDMARLGAVEINIFDVVWHTVQHLFTTLGSAICYVFSFCFHHTLYLLPIFRTGFIICHVMGQAPSEFSLKFRSAKMQTDREWLMARLDSTQALDILEWRSVAISFGQSSIQSLGSGRYHPKQKASAFLKADLSLAPSQLTQALQETLGSFNRSVLQLEEVITSIGTTTIDDARATTKKLLDKSVAAEKDIASLSQAVEAFGAWKAGQSKEAKAKSRQSKFKIGQFVKSLVNMGTPASLAKLFANSGWIEAPEGCDADSWPDYLVTSLDMVSERTGEDLLEDKAIWTKRPIFFDLSGSFAAGSFMSLWALAVRVSSSPKLVSHHRSSSMLTFHMFSFQEWWCLNVLYNF